MVKKIIKTNPNLIELINKLNKQSKSEDAAIWKDVADRLSTILVPGKVLSNGELDKKVNVVALKFSAKAQEKIESAGGECISIDEIIETNPKGSNIRIIE